MVWFATSTNPVEWALALEATTGNIGWQAIQSALAAGRPVVLGDGTYDLTGWQTFVPTSPVYLSGSSRTKLVFGDANLTLFKGQASIYLVGLAFEGCGSVIESADTDTAGTVEALEVDRCSFIGLKAPIAIEKPFSWFRVTNCNFTSCKNDAIRVGKNDYAQQENWKRMIVANNMITGMTGTASNAVRGIIIYGKHATITGNVIDGAVGTGSNECHALYTKCRYATITGNTVRGITTGTVTSGITIKGKPRGVTDDPQGFGCTVSGNTIDCGAVTEYGVRVDCGEANVSGNNVSDAAVTAVDIASDLTSRMIVANNLLYGQDVASTIGIAANTDGINIQIVGNQSHGYRKGIKVGASTTSLTDVLLANNKLTNCTTHGIEISPAVALTGLAITGNYIRTTGNQGIKFSGSGVVTDVSITGNDIQGSSYGVVSDGGAALVRLYARGNKIRTTGAIARQFAWTTGLTPAGIDTEATYETQTTSATAVYVWNWEMADNTAWHVVADVTATKSDGTARASYQLIATFYRNGGGATLQGTETRNHEQESVAGWTATLMAHPSSTNNACLQLTGAAATTINWCAVVKVLAA